MPARRSGRTPHAAKEARTARLRGLRKAPSGIQGLDEITGGGLPRGRPTLICGAPGCGKTLFGMEFLVRGAVEHDEPGVFMAFEETAEELAANVASLGFDLEKLQARKKLAIDYVRVERSEIEETGEYELEGLFVRIQHAYNGPDGIEKARKSRPDVVFCDIGLPGMDGYAVARVLRSEAGLSQALLVALTGYARPDDLRHAAEAGFDHHLGKPASLEQLSEVLGAGDR
jgi:CheY-like chemotaxis protein